MVSNVDGPVGKGRRGGKRKLRRWHGQRPERESHDEAVFSNSPMHEVANIAPRFLPVGLVHLRVIPCISDAFANE